jgi:3-carboxy-cis,cis-muconate cycloisomerase
MEAALARAEAAVGLIPRTAVASIVTACDADRYDVSRLGEAAISAGNLAIPLVKALTAEVEKVDADAARYVHWGATSQDIIDSALVLELRAAIDALAADLDRAIGAFVRLAEDHRNSPIAGRTFLQHALPIPFGLKVAGYAGALARARDRLQRVRGEALVLQFGGAAGSLASLGRDGLAVAERLANDLALPLPEAPWHSHRDRLAEVAAAFAILAGSCGKIARDVTLLMQTEVAETFEPAAPGRGGSSTLPHKRNPVAATAALAAATIAPNLAATIFAAQVGEHERAVGAWHAEWPTLPALALVTSGALQAVVDIAEGLEVDVARMRTNLSASGGLIMAEAVAMALARKLGKQNAHHLVEEASRKAAAERRHLKDVLADDHRVSAHLSHAELEGLFDPLAYQGAAQALIDRLIAAARQPPASPASGQQPDADPPGD